MKLYNKFVESKKEPSNKSDIWFDGSSWNMYKEGMWRPFTISLEQAQALYRYVENFKLFKIVDALPQIGQDNTIYLIENKDSIEGNSLIEYIYINDKWEEVGKFTPEINLDDYAKKSDIVQSDYNQSDTTAKDYIKNKPCDKYIQNFNVTDTFINNESLVPFDNDGLVGEKYPKLYLKVTELNANRDVWFETVLNAIDNHTYEVYENNDVKFSINTGAGGEEVVLEINDTFGYISNTYPDGIDIEFYTISKYLDSAYLSSDIARQSEITRLENRIAELENIIEQINYNK